MSSDSASGAGGGGDAGSSSPSPPSSSAALSNKDFRQFLQTKSNPTTATNNKEKKSNKEEETTTTTTTTTKSTKSVDSTPGPSGSSSLKYAADGTRTVKFTKHGLETGDDDADGGEGEDGDEHHTADDDERPNTAGAGVGMKKGGKVLSSRERSYIAYQAKQAAKAESKTIYRDRAKERALGANPDYDDSTLTGVSIDHLSVEATKFLGGDFAHTHLVKGLDFALLEKRKSELERQEEERMEKMIEDKLEEKSKKMEVATAVATPAAAAATTTAAVKPITRSTTAASIFAIATAPRPSISSSRTDLFLPGRMSYSFPLSSHVGGPSGSTRFDLAESQTHLNTLPSTQLTSLSDLAPAQANWNEENVCLSLATPLWTRVVGIFTQKRKDEEERKRKRKNRNEGNGYNVTKEDHDNDTNMMETDHKSASAGAASSVSSSAASAVASAAAPAAASSDAMELDYSVPRPPADDSDDDDDDIFAGAGSDYVAKIAPDEPMYDVARPPPDSDEEEDEEEGRPLPPPPPPPMPVSAPTPTHTRGLAAVDPSIRQLDKVASRMVDSDEDDDDIFVSSTAAGDELLGTVESDKNLTADEKRKRRAAQLADEEYAELFPEHHTMYSSTIDDEEDQDDHRTNRPKPGGTDEPDPSSHKSVGKGGKTPFRRNPDDLDAKKHEARFNAEFSQVTQMLKARGVKLNDDSRRRQTNPGKEVDDERAIKRQKILHAFKKK